MLCFISLHSFSVSQLTFYPTNISSPHVTHNFSPWSMMRVPAHLVANGDDEQLISYLSDLKLPTRSTTAPVSHGASISLDYLSMINSSSWHLQREVTIHNCSPSVAVPTIYPTTSCVALTHATTTAT